MSAANLPTVNCKYHRSLLNEVKLGKGKHMKMLRDELDARPEIKRHYMREREIELANDKQRQSMMWTKDANSRVKRVQSEFRDTSTYTNPMHVRQVPDKQFVETTMQRKNNTWIIE